MQTEASIFITLASATCILQHRLPQGVPCPIRDRFKHMRGREGGIPAIIGVAFLAQGRNPGQYYDCTFRFVLQS